MSIEQIAEEQLARYPFSTGCRVTVNDGLQTIIRGTVTGKAYDPVLGEVVFTLTGWGRKVFPANAVLTVNDYPMR